MPPDSADQPPRRFRFTLWALFVALTVVSLSFGIVGVPVTLYLAGWLAAMMVYFFIADRWGVFAAIIALAVCFWLGTLLVTFAIQALNFGFR